MNRKPNFYVDLRYLQGQLREKIDVVVNKIFVQSDDCISKTLFIESQRKCVKKENGNVLNVSKNAHGEISKIAEYTETPQQVYVRIFGKDNFFLYEALKKLYQYFRIYPNILSNENKVLVNSFGNNHPNSFVRNIICIRPNIGYGNLFKKSNVSFGNDILLRKKFSLVVGNNFSNRYYGIPKRHYSSCEEEDPCSKSLHPQIAAYKRSKHKQPPLSKYCSREIPKKKGFFSKICSLIGCGKKKSSKQLAKGVCKDGKPLTLAKGPGVKKLKCGSMTKSPCQDPCKPASKCQSKTRKCPPKPDPCKKAEECPPPKPLCKMVDKCALKSKKPKCPPEDPCESSEKQMRSTPCVEKLRQNGLSTLKKEPKEDKGLEDLCKRYDIEDIWMSDNVDKCKKPCPDKVKKENKKCPEEESETEEVDVVIQPCPTVTKKFDDMTPKRAIPCIQQGKKQQHASATAQKSVSQTIYKLNTGPKKSDVSIGKEILCCNLNLENCITCMTKDIPVQPKDGHQYQLRVTISECKKGGPDKKPSNPKDCTVKLFDSKNSEKNCSDMKKFEQYNASSLKPARVLQENNENNISSLNDTQIAIGEFISKHNKNDDSLNNKLTNLSEKKNDKDFSSINNSQMLSMEQISKDNKNVLNNATTISSQTTSKNLNKLVNHATVLRNAITKDVKQNGNTLTDDNSSNINVNNNNWQILPSDNIKTQSNVAQSVYSQNSHSLSHITQQSRKTVAESKNNNFTEMQKKAFLNNLNTDSKQQSNYEDTFIKVVKNDIEFKKQLERRRFLNNNKDVKDRNSKETSKQNTQFEDDTKAIKSNIQTQNNQPEFHHGKKPVQDYLKDTASHNMLDKHDKDTTLPLNKDINNLKLAVPRKVFKQYENIKNHLSDKTGNNNDVKHLQSLLSEKTHEFCKTMLDVLKIVTPQNNNTEKRRDNKTSEEDIKMKYEKMEELEKTIKLLEQNLAKFLNFEKGKIDTKKKHIYTKTDLKKLNNKKFKLFSYSEGDTDIEVSDNNTNNLRTSSTNFAKKNYHQKSLNNEHCDVPTNSESNLMSGDNTKVKHSMNNKSQNFNLNEDEFRTTLLELIYLFTKNESKLRKLNSKVTTKVSRTNNERKTKVNRS